MTNSTAQQAIDRFRPETAWEAYFPSRTNRWDEVKVGHLWRRAAFGASWDQMRAGLEQSPEELTSQLLQGDARLEEFDAGVERIRRGVLETNDVKALQALWMQRLLSSPHPLQERMTLFWHDHFATSNAKVDNARLMDRQLKTLRTHALGNFGQLLQDMTVDPAMLIWLDANTNRKGAPNENFAREVFELFGLGPGNYTEQDIQEAARAFTGWSVLNEQPVLTFPHHDYGEKTIFGQTGRFTAGDVIRLVLGQPACGRFIVRKLFGEFISEGVAPPDELIEPLADEFRLRNYDISWVMGRMLRSWVFYSRASISQRIKSPVEYVVGTVKSLSGRVSPAKAVEICAKMGQSLLYPPSVKGWDGGDRWINSATLLQRQNLAFELTRGAGSARSCDPAQLVLHEGISGEQELATFFLRLFHQDVDKRAVEQIAEQLRREGNQSTSPWGAGAARVAQARLAAHLALTMPDYQLG